MTGAGDNEGWPFSDVVGRVVWSVASDRAEMTNVVRAAARYSHDPKSRHRKDVEELLAYLSHPRGVSSRTPGRAVATTVQARPCCANMNITTGEKLVFPPSRPHPRPTVWCIRQKKESHGYARTKMVATDGETGRG